MHLVTELHLITQNFPSSELYGLTNQIRRSASSIPTNIAEGSARNYRKELIQFLHISLGSAAELDTQLEIAHNLDFISSDQNKLLNEKLQSISKMIHGLIRYQRSRITEIK
jgi:four helix bundle protein